MPPLTIPGLRFLGRPVKPVAFGFMLSLFVYFWAGVSDDSVLDGTRWGDAVGLVALAIAVAHFGAWWFRKQKVAEYGLLATFIFYFWDAMTNLLVTGVLHDVATLLAFSMSVIAGGSYLLEKADPDATTRW